MLLRRLILVLVALTAFATLPARAQTNLSSLSIFSDSTNQFSSSILLPPTYTDVKVLVANVSQTQAIPAFAKWVVFSANCNFFAATGGTAAVPAVSTTNGSSPMQNPAAWMIQGYTQLTVVADGACRVTMSFYQ